MSEKTPPAVGIDLGTTFSAIAHLDDTGRPVTLVNGEGDLITPSVVLIDGEDIVVGKEAVKALSTEAQRVAVFAKRDMGRKEFHEIVDNRRFPPEVLQAMILRKLVADAQRQIGEFRQAVITVPAYFDEVRRKATQDAGYMAGIEVLDIINEPTAAAISFGHQQGFLNERGEATAPQKILVYDLGGGTFDVTLTELKGTQFITLAVDGDSELGGRDWDYRLMHYVAEQFLAQHGADPREDPAAKGKLWRECEDAKRTLSARNKTRITCDYRGLTTNVEITREKFEEITHDLLDRTRFTTRQVLQAAKLDWGSVDRVLLVGGSSRMPMVRDMLRQLSGKVPDDSVSADEAVAHGAALHAGLILAKSQGQPAKFHIRNVNSHSLGVVGVDPQTGRKRVAAVIPRNTPLPVAAKRTFRTQKAGQDSILVQIVEGESPAPDACTQIGRCVVRDLPANLPAETPIEVRFEYAPNGRLAVKVKVANTDKELRHELHRDNSMNAEQLDQWRTRLART